MMTAAEAQLVRDPKLNAVQRVYERITRRFTPYAYRTDLPRYSLTYRTNDGIIRNWPRWAHHLVTKFGLAFIITVAMLALGFSGLASLLAPTIVNLLIKVIYKLSGTYKGDPFDWLCDVGALTFGGSLVAFDRFTPAVVPDWAYVVLVVVYVISYPWATP
jgi:hypothetical protein